MTPGIDYVFVIIALIALVFTINSFKVKNILFSTITALLWLALLFWMFFSPSHVFDFSETWVDILAYAFFCLMIMPFLALMDYEVRWEKDGHSWSTHGDRPEERGPTAYENYRKLLFNKTRRR